MPTINSLKQQGLLISCSSPYNKFKILVKVNFKILSNIYKKTIKIFNIKRKILSKKLFVFSADLVKL
jgi:hypothetical protein